MFRKKFGDDERVGRACGLERGLDVVPEGEGAIAVDRRTVTKSAVPAAAALLAGGGVAQARPAQAEAAQAEAAQAEAADDVTVRLPAPTGPHRIGVTTLHLVDRSRRDPWEPEIPVREVMVSVFYPARTVRGCPVAPHMSEGAAELFTTLGPMGHPELPRAGVNWAATMTHSHADAPAQAVRRPVLLYSPGGGDPRAMGTGIAEELASHGYVVVSIDHPGDASAVEFPHVMTGRDKVRPTVFRGDPRLDPKLSRTMIATRIADTRFVLDQLEVLAAAGPNPDVEGHALPEHLGRALDLRRVGVYGHSAGGTTAAETMYDDRRVGAAVNLEGYLDYPPNKPGEEGMLLPIARYGVDRPLLLLGTDGFPHRKVLERSWSAALAHSHGCTRRRQLDGAAHGVFTDYAAIAPQLQAAALMTADNRITLVGPVAPEESVPMVRSHVRSFFARHLPPL
ncbi:alpha/beta hydrolase [Streptomyces sp. NBC_01142]|uniref:alpha/beta hydrolase family protein n=1 Tax=Streptomyces sp. NBC_01142 TaxID=2975865 RepID=UPI00224E07F1|nr:alpha/beta hydrolase [Streptomyces sp. NBC_01142]MCX4825572.1 alpha/beta hydrolase [Streptomyces sp. NBC_01142]